MKIAGIGTLPADAGWRIFAFLSGDPVRERCPAYRTHTRTYRVRNAAMMDVPGIRTDDDMARNGKEIRHRGCIPWRDGIVTALPLIGNGERVLPIGPG
jgi:hypothetical protein